MYASRPGARAPWPWASQAVISIQSAAPPCTPSPDRTLEILSVGAASPPRYALASGFPGRHFNSVCFAPAHPVSGSHSRNFPCGSGVPAAIRLGLGLPRPSFRFEPRRPRAPRLRTALSRFSLWERLSSRDTPWTWASQAVISLQSASPPCTQSPDRTLEIFPDRGRDDGCRPSLRTGRADLPHPALQLVVVLTRTEVSSDGSPQGRRALGPESSDSASADDPCRR